MHRAFSLRYAILHGRLARPGEISEDADQWQPAPNLAVGREEAVRSRVRTDLEAWRWSAAAVAGVTSDSTHGTNQPMAGKTVLAECRATR